MTSPEIPATTRAAVLHGRRDLRFDTVRVPEAAAGELLIEVTAVGVCGTDAAEWAYGAKLMPIEVRHPVTGHLGPMTIGHEFAGRVVAVGPGVDDAWLDRLVASRGAGPCGSCDLCLTGRSNLCRRYWSVGLHRDGALASYVAAPAASCVDAGAWGLGEHEAALVQPMSIAVHAARRSGVVAGDVAVFFEVTGSQRGMDLAIETVPMGTTIVAVGIAKAAMPVDLGRVTVRELSIIGTNAMVRETDLDVAARLVAARAGRWDAVAPAPLPFERVVEDALVPIAEGRPPAVKSLVLPPPI